MNLFNRIWRRRRENGGQHVSVTPPCFVIGDIHGCADLLMQMLERCPEEAEVICVGDYIDRGDQSAQVLRFLFEHPKITCLMGNHEAMLLKFLENPNGRAKRWLRFGGIQTLESFGILKATENPDAADRERLAENLAKAMGPDLITWLRNLPSHAIRGNVLITHAGADPAKAPDEQDDDVMIWGHPAFASRRRTDNMWVLYGHVIVNIAEQRHGRISIDTGAYATGRLTAAHLGPDGCTFTEVTHITD